MKRLRLKRADISTEEVDPRAAKARGFRTYRVTARKMRKVNVSTSVGVVPFDVLGPVYYASVALGPETLGERAYCIHELRKAIANEPKGAP